MEPRIEVLQEKKLVGHHLSMSFAEDKTFLLWRSFMPRRNEILNRTSADYYSIQLFDPSISINQYPPDALFEKWAAVEVENFNSVPDNMFTLIIPSGNYAVFLHRGGPDKARETFEFIFGTWLPQSIYESDHRPQFEILGEKYKKNDPSSEEEIWIPIKVRG